MPRLASLTDRLLSGSITYTVPVTSAQYTGISLVPFVTNEGTTITATVTTLGVTNGVTVNYTVTGVSSSDLSSGSLTGSITINSNTGTATFGIANDGLTEGQDIFTITLAATDSAGTNTLSASASAIINDTSNNPGTALWLDNNDNPTTVRLVIGATSMQINGVFASNPSVPRTIEGRTSGTRTTITAITARTGTYIEVDDTGNSTNFVVGEGLNLANITYSVSPAANNINEGSGLTFTVTTTNLPDGITLYWTVNRPEDFATSSGSFTINSNSGTFTVTPTADATTEGAETFTASVRTGSTSGTVVATSSSVTINDTSLTPAAAPTLANRAIAWVDNQNSSTIYYSDTAGNNWTAANTGILDQWQTGARSGDNLMLVSANRRVITSTNGGQTWNQQVALLPTPSFQNFSFRHMATDGSTWVVIPRSESNQAGTQFFYSTNFGTSWTTGNFGASPDNFNFWEYVTYDNGRWIAFSSINSDDSGLFGPRYAVSSDGISWGATINTNKPGGFLYPGYAGDITYSSSANKWYFGRETGTAGQFRLFIGSSTGNSWTIKLTSPAGSTTFLRNHLAVNDAGRLVLVNTNILNTWYSDDEGTTWNVVSGVWPTTGAFPNSTGDLNRLRVLNDQFACVMNGVIYYSVDGVGWSTPSSPPSGTINHIL